MQTSAQGVVSTPTRIRPIPPASALPDCQALVGTYPFTVTATGRTLGIVGQAQGTLNIVAQPPELTSVVPNADGRVGGDRVLFGWRSNTPGDSTVYYRRQGEPSYTTLPLAADARDPRLYSAAVDVSADAEGTVFEWYGTIDNGCTVRSIGSAADPQTFTRVRSTTFLDPAYAFRVADGYDLTVGDDLNTGEVRDVPLTIRVRNDDDQARAILLDVENPYEDLILGFTGSGSVDQVLLLQPGQTFDAPLRVFTQATEREVYALAIRLENDRGDVDRIPLVIEVRQPNLALDIQVLAVDPRTLVTTARLTNLGDTITDLSLDIVQASSGIPANFVIQPDIQHTYLLAGQSLEIAFIPLDLQDSAAAPANMSVAQFDPLTNTPLSSAPSLAAIAGPYRITASARNSVIPNVTLRDGELTNTCGAGGSVQTIAANCTTPAGSETRLINDWYCTNRPNIDVPVSLALPNGGLGVPITSVTAGANFSPGGGVYSHSTTVSLNSSLVGSAIVPSVSRIENSLPPQALILGGSSPTQLLSLRSTHTNGTHYTVARGFTVTVEYDEHTRTGCFTQAEVDAASTSGGPLMCTPSSVLVVPEQELELSLLPTNEDNLLPQDVDGAYLVTQGESFTISALVSASGASNVTEPVQIELSVPRGILPQGMTIVGEDPITLSEIFGTLACLLTGGTDCGDLPDDVLRVLVGDQGVTYTYITEVPVVIGQPFPIRLNVVGDDVGDFDVVGIVSSATDMMPLALDQYSVSSTQLEPTLTPLTVTQTIRVNALSNVLDCDSLPQSAIVEQLADTYRFVIQESDLIDESEVRASCRAVVNTANALQRFAAVVPEGPDYESSADAFINIMLSTQNGTITYSNTTSTTQVGASNCKTGPTTIVCGAQNVLSEYTMTHELGHVFLYRSANATPVDGSTIAPCPLATGGVGFIGCMDDPNLPSSDPNSNSARALRGANSETQFVFGIITRRLRPSIIQNRIDNFDPTNRYGITSSNFPVIICQDGTRAPCEENGTPVPPVFAEVTDWERGVTGWDVPIEISDPNRFGACGNASGGYEITDFQQNPCVIYEWVLNAANDESVDDLTVVELEEAGADMFLNWVYRAVEDNTSAAFGDNTSLQQEPTGRQFTGCTVTPSGHGDDRFCWMQENLRLFFQYYSW